MFKKKKEKTSICIDSIEQPKQQIAHFLKLNSLYTQSHNKIIWYILQLHSEKIKKE